MNRDIYKYMLRTYGKSIGVWFGFLCSLVSSVLITAIVVIPIAKVAAAISGGDFPEARRQVVIYLIISVVGAVIRYIGNLSSLYFESRVYTDESINFYKSLTSKDMSFYLENKTGYLIASYRQFIDGCIELARTLRQPILWTFISIISANIILAIKSPKIGGIVFIIVIVQFLYIRWSSTLVLKYRKVSHEAYRVLTGMVSDDVTNILAFRSSGSSKHHEKEIVKVNHDNFWAFWKRYQITESLDLPRALVTYVGIAITVIILIDSSESSPQSVELIVLTITYLFSINRNILRIPEIVRNYDDILTKIYPNIHIVNDDRSIVDKPKAKNIQIKNANIQISNLSFSYSTKSKNRISVLRDINLDIQDGESVGIVGLSGSGKSTLANLLMRFYDVEDGAITIDGQDIRNVTQESLRKSIAYVPQEPLLFHKSIRENITYFSPKASEKQIIKAAKAAHAHGFIKELPDGYDSVVGERGMKLSGGQKQRVVIARSILKQAQIMVFDEATSALDSESEQIIQKALPGIIGKHTAIVIAHRLSTVAGLDRIIVLDKGQIVEEGTHTALLKKKGKYSELWRKQTQA